MTKDDFLDAFRRLGGQLSEPVRLIMAGGSAMILAGYIDRDTGDADAIEADPKLAKIQRQIAAVGEEIGVKADWLNDGVRAWLDLLPPDFHERVEPVGVFGMLTVARLSRRDLILMKLAALRPRDLDDLEALEPTSEEIAWIAAQLDRINRVNPMSALRVQMYLDQGADRERRSDGTP